MSPQTAPTAEQIEDHPAVIAARAAEARFHHAHPAHAAAWFAVLASDNADGLGQAQHDYHLLTDPEVRNVFGRILEANIEAWDTATAALTTKEPQ